MAMRGEPRKGTELTRQSVPAPDAHRPRRAVRSLAGVRTRRGLVSFSFVELMISETWQTLWFHADIRVFLGSFAAP
jgi:hypothetical protein